MIGKKKNGVVDPLLVVNNLGSTSHTSQSLDSRSRQGRQLRGRRTVLPMLTGSPESRQEKSRGPDLTQPVLPHQHSLSHRLKTRIKIGTHPPNMLLFFIQSRLLYSERTARKVDSTAEILLPSPFGKKECCLALVLFLIFCNHSAPWFPS